MMKSEVTASTGWVVGWIGWYRKSFPTQSVQEAGRVVLLFDGVYPKSELWINGI